MVRVATTTAALLLVTSAPFVAALPSPPSARRSFVPAGRVENERVFVAKPRLGYTAKQSGTTVKLDAKLDASVPARVTVDSKRKRSDSHCGGDNGDASTPPSGDNTLDVDRPHPWASRTRRQLASNAHGKRTGGIYQLPLRHRIGAPPAGKKTRKFGRRDAPMSLVSQGVAGWVEIASRLFSTQLAKTVAGLVTTVDPKDNQTMMLATSPTASELFYLVPAQMDDASAASNVTDSSVNGTSSAASTSSTPTAPSSSFATFLAGTQKDPFSAVPPAKSSAPSSKPASVASTPNNSTASDGGNNATSTSEPSFLQQALAQLNIVHLVMPVVNSATLETEDWCASFSTVPPSALSLALCGAPSAGTAQMFAYNETTGELTPFYVATPDASTSPSSFSMNATSANSTNVLGTVSKDSNSTDLASSSSASDASASMPTSASSSSSASSTSTSSSSAPSSTPSGSSSSSPAAVALYFVPASSFASEPDTSSQGSSVASSSARPTTTAASLSSLPVPSAAAQAAKQDDDESGDSDDVDTTDSGDADTDNSGNVDTSGGDNTDDNSGDGNAYYSSPYYADWTDGSDANDAADSTAAGTGGDVDDSSDDSAAANDGTDDSSQDGDSFVAATSAASASVSSSSGASPSSIVASSSSAPSSSSS